MLKHKILHIGLVIITVLSLLSACSTHKNTATTRWWKAFNTRYNVYYNGKMAYIDGSLEKEKSHKDNFTELLPLYSVSSKASRETGKGSFERAIVKSKKAIRLYSINKKPEFTKERKKTEREKEWLSRKEYNPFLWKAWLLMGRSQFYKGSFDEAASTFSYMIRLYKTQPSIAQRAKAWLAKCYIEQGWLYDAEEIISEMKRDSVHWRAQKEWNYTLTDYYIRAKNYDLAAVYLRKVIKTEMRRLQKAREWYLLGQLYESLNQKENAFNAYKQVVKLNPPYHVEFNARIAMSEVMAQNKASAMIRKLKNLTLSDKNKNYKDRIFYALGNVYLTQKDTLNAINAYEKGRKESVNGGIEKGVLTLKLGDIYWQKERYDKAKDCYTEAVGLLDKDRKDYEQLTIRSKVLDQLVPFTNEVALQDSLQALVLMPENERLSVIDKAIVALKKKEKEEKRSQQESYAQGVMQENAGFQGETMPSFAPQNTSIDGNLWYFYNPQVVNQGKTAFERWWGRRANKDNWQRSNVTVVKNEAEKHEPEESNNEVLEANDSLMMAQEQQKNDLKANPYHREYYLAQLPFTPEQQAESNAKRNEALFQVAVIFKDKLNNARLSERAFMRLLSQTSSFTHLPDVYYHLFLLYSQQKNEAKASVYLAKLKQEFPHHDLTKLVSNPYFAENAGLGAILEDSLYAKTYLAFKENNTAEVINNAEIAKKRFPMGANKDKFLFVGALSKLNEGRLKDCLTDLQTLVATYPESKMSTFAGYIINGVNAGKKVHTGKFSLDEMWNKRALELNNNDSTVQRKFVKDLNVDFLFTMVYSPDSIERNKLLYAIARHNFTHYPVRHFAIAVEPLESKEQMVVSGFHNYQEVLAYARAFYEQNALHGFLKSAQVVLISAFNEQLLGKQLSLKAYQQFYKKHFAEVKPLLHLQLNEPETVVTKQAKEVEETDNSAETTPTDDTIFVPLNDESEEVEHETIIPITTDDNSLPQNAPLKDSATVVKSEPNTKAEPINKPAIKSITKSVNTAKTKTLKAKKAVSPPQKSVNSVPQANSKTPNPTAKTGIYFGDGFGEPTSNASTNVSKATKTKKKRTDLDDDYYELEGF